MFTQEIQNLGPFSVPRIELLLEPILSSNIIEINSQTRFFPFDTVCINTQENKKMAVDTRFFLDWRLYYISSTVGRSCWARRKG